MNADPLHSLRARRTDRTPATQTRRARRRPVYLLWVFGVGSAVLALAAGSAAASPLLASIVNPNTLPTPAHDLSFAHAVIAKPTYTATATLPPAPTATATLEPSPTPGQLLAEVIADTPTSEYAPPADDQAAPVYESVSEPSYGGNKYILVDISDQHMYVYENEALAFSFVASTGMNNATATGQFSVLDKIPSAYGSTWDIWMPNWLGIYWAGGLENGIHALPVLSNGVTLWSGFLGRPISYGCVVLGSYESQLLYDWVEIGTPVEIRW